jgi:DNA helicase II / ATP-dependent DNA helicase PcrA
MIQNVKIPPTKEQIDICESSYPRILVEANAGAAKTTTAALKIKRLISQGFDPQKIVVLSYSQAGVIAYREALSRVDVNAEIIKLLQPRTFEDFCAECLFEFEHLDVYRPTTPEQVREHVLQAVDDARLWADVNYPNEFSLGTGQFEVESLLKNFAQIKGSMAIQRA